MAGVCIIYFRLEGPHFKVKNEHKNNQFSPWLSFQYIILMPSVVLLCFKFRHKPQGTLTETTKQCIKNSYNDQYEPCTQDLLVEKMDVSNPFSPFNIYAYMYMVQPIYAAYYLHYVLSLNTILPPMGNIDLPDNLPNKINRYTSLVWVKRLDHTYNCGCRS